MILGKTYKNWTGRQAKKMPGYCGANGALSDKQSKVAYILPESGLKDTNTMPEVAAAFGA